jgi:hypothetical protein
MTRLKTPFQVQSFLRQMEYNRADTLSSAEQTLLRGSAHCFEAVFLAAYLLEPQGYEPWVISFESQDDLDHTIFVFKENGLWGSVARSRDEGLHGRAPKFKTIEKLAWSYFDPYVDKTGKLTGWQLFHLDETGHDWRRGRKPLWKLESHLFEVQHHDMNVPPSRYRRLKSRYFRNGPLTRGRHWW